MRNPRRRKIHREHSASYVTKDELRWEVWALKNKIEKLEGAIREYRAELLDAIEATSDCMEALADDGHYEHAAQSKTRLSTLRTLLSRYEAIDPRYGSIGQPYN
jgi:hypothetical protein